MHARVHVIVVNEISSQSPFSRSKSSKSTKSSIFTKGLPLPKNPFSLKLQFLTRRRQARRAAERTKGLAEEMAESLFGEMAVSDRPANTGGNGQLQSRMFDPGGGGGFSSNFFPHHPPRDQLFHYQPY
eukprot:SAG31_NODE_2431_length_5707_cov_2.157810_8_plen_128_part_00